MIVDSHQHFWRLSRSDYDWLTPDLGPDLATLYRDFEPADLAPHLAAHGIQLLWVEPVGAGVDVVGHGRGAGRARPSLRA